MKKTISLLLLVLSLASVACKKETTTNNNGNTSTNSVTGKITDANGRPLVGAKVTIEHTVWANSYVSATTDANGFYQAIVPAEPAGDWTAKAQVNKTAYGQDYKFDLEADKTDAFKSGQSVVRNFTWKLSGAKPGGTGYYGAHVDLYSFGTGATMTEVKLVFTPLNASATLIDGSPVPSFERKVEDVAGTFMVKDIPIGQYNVKAVYAGKTLLLQNRHGGQPASQMQPVTFGKNGYLGDTEYNVEFWLSE